jgi:hypothetical protein
MSATKGKKREQIGQQLKRLLAGGGASDFKMDNREIELAMNQTRDFLVKTNYFQRYAQFQDFNIDQTYLHRYKNVEVKKDCDTDEVYCELPANTISLPSNREVYQVRLMQDTQNVFIPVNPNSFAINGEGQSVYLDGQVSFYRVGGNLYFHNLNHYDFKKGKGLLMTLASAGDSLPDNAEYIGGDLEEELVNRVLQRLMPSAKMNETKQGNDLIN